MAEAGERSEVGLDHPVGVGVLAAFLKTGRMLDHASSVFLLGVLLSTAQLPGSAAMAVALIAAAGCAIAEKYYAWRVALDAELFAVLLRHPQESRRFDSALAAFLGRSSQPAERSMHSRWQGARRLLRRQIKPAVPAPPS